jgi:hypothetical protein
LNLHPGNNESELKIDSNKQRNYMVSANLVDRFKDICNEINDISGNSEQEFLSIGSRLQSYLSGSRNLSGVSFKALSSVSDSNLKKAISELNSMLNKFSDYFSHSRSSQIS